jgi:hypothetical protein
MRLSQCPNGNAPAVFDDKSGTRVNVHCECGCRLSVWALRAQIEAAWNAATLAVWDRNSSPNQERER